MFHTLFRESLVGRVTIDRVVLHRHQPFCGNPCGWFFFGKFRVHGNATMLEGKFAMHWFLRAFLGFAFGFLIVFLLAVGSGAVSDVKLGKVELLTAAFYFAVFMLGALVIALGTVGLVIGYQGHEDSEYIASAIRETLDERSI
jgi:hypothetical protein